MLQASMLATHSTGYLRVVETAQDSKGSNEKDRALSAHLRALWKGRYVVNGGYDGLRGEEALRTGHADAVPYGHARFWPTQIYQGGCNSEPL